MLNRLAIGSANFGLEYGIANRKKLPKEEVFRILQTASAQGIWGVDTAKDYGDSEKVIGNYFKEHGKSIHLITKLPKKEYQTPQEVEKEVLDSIQALHISSIDVLLVHSYETLKQHGKVILPALQTLRREKVIGRYGVSVYHPEEAKEISRVLKDPLAMEFPVNLFDRRFLKADLLQKFHAEGGVSFARSVFLQGLFFLKEENLTGPFEKVKSRVRLIHEIAKEHEVKPEWISLLFVMAQPWIDNVIVGVDCEEQLMSHVQALTEDSFKRYRTLEHLLPELETSDEEIIVPSRWRR